MQMFGKKCCRKLLKRKIDLGSSRIMNVKTTTSTLMVTMFTSEFIPLLLPNCFLDNRREIIIAAEVVVIMIVGIKKDVTAGCLSKAYWTS